MWAEVVFKIEGGIEHARLLLQLWVRLPAVLFCQALGIKLEDVRVLSTTQFVCVR
jgi:hypothetical protein